MAKVKFNERTRMYDVVDENNNDRVLKSFEFDLDALAYSIELGIEVVKANPMSKKTIDDLKKSLNEG